MTTMNKDEIDELMACRWEVRFGTLETPPEYCDDDVRKGDDYCPHHQKLSDDMDGLEECRCSHLKRDHQGPEGLGGAQCSRCPEDGERMWRHPFVPKDF